MGIRLKEGLLEDPTLGLQSGIINQNPSRSSTPFLRITAVCRLCQKCDAKSGKYSIIIKENPFTNDNPHFTHSFVQVNHDAHQHLPQSPAAFNAITNQNTHNNNEHENEICWFDWIDSLTTLAKNYSIEILSQAMPGYIQAFSCLPDLSIHCFLQDQLECIQNKPY